MSFIKSITKDEMLSRLVGGRPKEEQEKAAGLLTDFFQVIADQMAFGNRVVIRDFGHFEPQEKQIPGKDTTFKVVFTPGVKLKAAETRLKERFGKTGLPAPMKNAVTGKTHGGKGTGNEETIVES